jgi:3-deoxy-D-manno-octulosonate 8-phosphate phosphatase (KDO 8-P phosphatase)
MLNKISIQKMVQLYASQGGVFVSTPEELTEKCTQTKALVFDWDGVFHDGTKNSTGESSFNEIDSMGINLLRFALFLESGEIPPSYIVTGELNPTARKYALREHFDGVYVGVKKKPQAIDHILQKEGVSVDQVAFFFDDILDLEVAKPVGTRWMIGKSSYPLLTDYVNNHELADYITGNSPGSHGLREATELFTGLLGKFETTLEKRIAFDEDYNSYWNLRNTKKTKFFTVSEGNISPLNEVENGQKMVQ